MLVSLLLAGTASQAQTTTCPSMYNRNNGNGGSTSCPGVSGTPIASNVSGSYATVPAGGKSADIGFQFASTDAWISTPPVIIATYTTASGVSTAVNTYPGPPGVPSVQANGSGQVKYCSYTGSSGNGNMPNAGVVTFRFANPNNISSVRTCTYDFSNGNVALANPAVLPVTFYNFAASKTGHGVRLSWIAAIDEKLSYFDIERSADGSSFQSIHQMRIAPNGSKGLADYSYLDAQANLGASAKVFYRVKGVDADGSMKLTPIAVIDGSTNQQQLSVAVLGQDIVVNAPAAQAAQAQVYSINGQLLRQWTLNLQPGSNNIGRLEGNGLLVRVITASGTTVARY